MNKDEYLRCLEQLAVQNPQLTSELKILALKIMESDNPDEVITEYLGKQAACMKSEDENAQTRPDMIFPVHKPYTREFRKKIKSAEQNEHLHNWARTVSSLPEYTLPVPVVDSNFILRAKDIWSQNIYGNEDVLEVILHHCIEYSKTGKTMPILLVGDPGVGKTLVAKNYASILNLPSSFVSCPSAASGRGLSGAPNIYAGAGAGVVVQAMINHHAGNPVFFCDELDKITGRYSNIQDFENELLMLLDESSDSWYDNYLETCVDASHIPFIFAANEKDLISPPLLDRMDVVRMESPTLEMLHGIAWKFTLPRTMSLYDSDQIQFGKDELDYLVDSLWNNGIRSCRTFQKAVKILVSKAYLKVIENNCSVVITEPQIRATVDMCLQGNRKKTVGFGA